MIEVQTLSRIIDAIENWKMCTINSSEHYFIMSYGLFIVSMILFGCMTLAFGYGIKSVFVWMFG